MRASTIILLAIMIAVPLFMYIYFTGFNNGVSVVTDKYIDSVNMVLDNINLTDNDIIDINELTKYDINVSEFNLEKFKLNNGFDLKELYKDNISFYNLDTVDIDSIGLNKLDFVMIDFYLANQDTIIYDKYYIIIASTDYTKVISLYNEIPENKYISCDKDLYKVVKEPIETDRNKAMFLVKQLSVRSLNLRMIILK